MDLSFINSIGTVRTNIGRQGVFIPPKYSINPPSLKKYLNDQLGHFSVPPRFPSLLENSGFPTWVISRTFLEVALRGCAL